MGSPLVPLIIPQRNLPTQDPDSPEGFSLPWYRYFQRLGSISGSGSVGPPGPEGPEGPPGPPGPGAAAKTGFGFFAGGTMTSGELLGTAVWGVPRTFGVNPLTVMRALWPPTGAVTFTFSTYDTLGNRFQIGSGAIAAGSPVGFINWSGLTTVPAGFPIEINAPVPADPSLASVRAMIYSIN